MKLSIQWRFTAMLTALIYVPVNHFGFAALPTEPVRTESAQIKPFAAEALRLPVKFGEVVESHSGNGNIVIIQDAHAIPDAQRNIANVIRFMQKEYGVGTVALEGASGDLDPQIFRSFPDKKLLRQVMKGYMDAGEIAGGTAAAIFDETQTKYVGVEDWDVYEEGLGLYLSAIEKEPNLLEKLNAERLKLNAEKEKVYSKELIEIDQAVEQFYENAAQITDLIKLLGAVQAPQAGSELDALWKEVKKSQEPGTKNQGKDIEVRALAAKVEKALSAPRTTGHGPRLEVAQPVKQRGLSPLAVFNSKKQEWMTGEISPEAFALYLKETAQKLGLKLEMSSHLMSMVKDQHTLKGIEGTKMFRDLEIYIREAKQQLIERTTDHPSTLLRAGEPPLDVAQGKRAMIGDSSSGSVPSKARGLTPVLLELDDRTESLRLVTKLAKLELPRNEWSELSKGKVFEALSALGLNQEDFVFHLAFYLNAEERDEIFFKNLIASHEPRTTSHETKIIVAGGFHAEGITSRLKEAGIGYALVMPKINHIPESLNYRAQMRGEVSWKDYFEVENGRIHLYKAFVRATRDKLLASGTDPNAGSGKGSVPDVQILKAWRDQIIRDLSDQGKVQRAAWYTRYMDEVVDDTLKHTDADKLMSKVDNFIRGLRGLEKANQLTSEQIAALLKANMIQTTHAVPLAPSIMAVAEPKVPEATLTLFDAVVKNLSVVPVPFRELLKRAAGVALIATSANTSAQEVSRGLSNSAIDGLKIWTKKDATGKWVLSKESVNQIKNEIKKVLGIPQNTEIVISDGKEGGDKFKDDFSAIEKNGNVHITIQLGNDEQVFPIVFNAYAPNTIVAIGGDNTFQVSPDEFKVVINDLLKIKEVISEEITSKDKKIEFVVAKIKGTKLWAILAFPFTSKDDGFADAAIPFIRDMSDPNKPLKRLPTADAANPAPNYPAPSGPNTRIGVRAYFADDKGELIYAFRYIKSTSLSNPAQFEIWVPHEPGFGASIVNPSQPNMKNSAFIIIDHPRVRSESRSSLDEFPFTVRIVGQALLQEHEGVRALNRITNAVEAKDLFTNDFHVIGDALGMPRDDRADQINEIYPTIRNDLLEYLQIIAVGKKLLDKSISIPQLVKPEERPDSMIYEAIGSTLRLSQGGTLSFYKKNRALLIEFIELKGVHRSPLKKIHDAVKVIRDGNIIGTGDRGTLSENAQAMAKMAEREKQAANVIVAQLKQLAEAGLISEVSAEETTKKDDIWIVTFNGGRTGAFIVEDPNEAQDLGIGFSFSPFQLNPTDDPKIATMTHWELIKPVGVKYVKKYRLPARSEARKTIREEKNITRANAVPGRSQGGFSIYEPLVMIAVGLIAFTVITAFKLVTLPMDAAIIAVAVSAVLYWFIDRAPPTKESRFNFTSAFSFEEILVISVASSAVFGVIAALGLAIAPITAGIISLVSGTALYSTVKRIFQSEGRSGNKELSTLLEKANALVIEWLAFEEQVMTSRDAIEILAHQKRELERLAEGLLADLEAFKTKSNNDSEIEFAVDAIDRLTDLINRSETRLDDARALLATTTVSVDGRSAFIKELVDSIEALATLKKYRIDKHHKDNLPDTSDIDSLVSSLELRLAGERSILKGYIDTLPNADMNKGELAALKAKLAAALSSVKKNIAAAPIEAREQYGPYKADQDKKDLELLISEVNRILESTRDGDLTQSVVPVSWWQSFLYPAFLEIHKLIPKATLLGQSVLLGLGFYVPVPSSEYTEDYATQVDKKLSPLNEPQTDAKNTRPLNWLESFFYPTHLLIGKLFYSEKLDLEILEAWSVLTFEGEYKNWDKEDQEQVHNYGSWSWSYAFHALKFYKYKKLLTGLNGNNQADTALKLEQLITADLAKSKLAKLKEINLEETNRSEARGERAEQASNAQKNIVRAAVVLATVAALAGGIYFGVPALGALPAIKSIALSIFGGASTASIVLFANWFQLRTGAGQALSDFAKLREMDVARQVALMSGIMLAGVLLPFLNIEYFAMGIGIALFGWLGLVPEVVSDFRDSERRKDAEQAIKEDKDDPKVIARSWENPINYLRDKNGLVRRTWWGKPLVDPERGYAHPPLFYKRWYVKLFRNSFFKSSAEKKLEFDAKGRPINPLLKDAEALKKEEALRGEALPEGRGNRGLYGANPAGDPVVWRMINGVKKIAMALRKDERKYSLPGGNQRINESIDGWVQDIEKALLGAKVISADRKDLIREIRKTLKQIKAPKSLIAALREFTEETGILLSPAAIKRIVDQGPVYKGYVHGDPRNRRNAWMETTAWQIEIQDDKVDIAVEGLKTIDNNVTEIRWFTLEEIRNQKTETGEKLEFFANHRDIILKAFPAISQALAAVAVTQQRLNAEVETGPNSREVWEKFIKDGHFLIAGFSKQGFQNPEYIRMFIDDVVMQLKEMSPDQNWVGVWGGDLPNSEIPTIGNVARELKEVYPNILVGAVKITDNLEGAVSEGEASLAFADKIVFMRKQVDESGNTLYGGTKVRSDGAKTTELVGASRHYLTQSLKTMVVMGGGGVTVSEMEYVLEQQPNVPVLLYFSRNHAGAPGAVTEWIRQKLKESGAEYSLPGKAELFYLVPGFRSREVKVIGGLLTDVEFAEKVLAVSKQIYDETAGTSVAVTDSIPADPLGPVANQFDVEVVVNTSSFFLLANFVDFFKGKSNAETMKQVLERIRDEKFDSENQKEFLRLLANFAYKFTSSFRKKKEGEPLYQTLVQATEWMPAHALDKKSKERDFEQIQWAAEAMLKELEVRQSDMDQRGWNADQVSQWELEQIQVMVRDRAFMERVALDNDNRYHETYSQEAMRDPNQTITLEKRKSDLQSNQVKFEGDDEQDLLQMGNLFGLIDAGLLGVQMLESGSTPLDGLLQKIRDQDPEIGTFLERLQYLSYVYAKQVARASGKPLDHRSKLGIWSLQSDANKSIESAFVRVVMHLVQQELNASRSETRLEAVDHLRLLLEPKLSHMLTDKDVTLAAEKVYESFRSDSKMDDLAMLNVQNLEDWIDVLVGNREITIKSAKTNAPIHTVNRVSSGVQLLFSDDIGLGAALAQMLLAIISITTPESQKPTVIFGFASSGQDSDIPDSPDLRLENERLAPLAAEALLAINQLSLKMPAEHASLHRFDVLIWALSLYQHRFGNAYDGLLAIVEVVRDLDAGKAIHESADERIDMTYLRAHPDLIRAAFQSALFNKSQQRKTAAVAQAKVEDLSDLAKIWGPEDVDPLAVLAAAMNQEGVHARQWGEISAAFTWNDNQSLSNFDAWYRAFRFTNLADKDGKKSESLRLVLQAVYYAPNGNQRSFADSQAISGKIGKQLSDGPHLTPDDFWRTTLNNNIGLLVNLKAIQQYIADIQKRAIPGYVKDPKNYNQSPAATAEEIASAAFLTQAFERLETAIREQSLSEVKAVVAEMMKHDYMAYTYSYADGAFVVKANNLAFRDNSIAQVRGTLDQFLYDSEVDWMGLKELALGEKPTLADRQRNIGTGLGAEKKLGLKYSEQNNDGRIRQTRLFEQIPLDFLLLRGEFQSEFSKPDNRLPTVADLLELMSDKEAVEFLDRVESIFSPFSIFTIDSNQRDKLFKAGATVQEAAILDALMTGVWPQGSETAGKARNNLTILKKYLTGRLSNFERKWYAETFDAQKRFATSNVLLRGNLIDAVIDRIRDEEGWTAQFITALGAGADIAEAKERTPAEKHSLIAERIKAAEKIIGDIEYRKKRGMSEDNGDQYRLYIEINGGTAPQSIAVQKQVAATAPRNFGVAVSEPVETPVGAVAHLDAIPGTWGDNYMKAAGILDKIYKALPEYYRMGWAGQLKYKVDSRAIKSNESLGAYLNGIIKELEQWQREETSKGFGYTQEVNQKISPLIASLKVITRSEARTLEEIKNEARIFVGKYFQEDTQIGEILSNEGFFGSWNVPDVEPNEAGVPLLKASDFEYSLQHENERSPKKLISAIESATGVAHVDWLVKASIFSHLYAMGVIKYEIVNIEFDGLGRNIEGSYQFPDSDINVEFNSFVDFFIKIDESREIKDIDIMAEAAGHLELWQKKIQVLLKGIDRNYLTESEKGELANPAIPRVNELSELAIARREAAKFLEDNFSDLKITELEGGFLGDHWDGIIPLKAVLTGMPEKPIIESVFAYKSKGELDWLKKAAVLGHLRKKGNINDKDGYFNFQLQEGDKNTDPSLWILLPSLSDAQLQAREFYNVDSLGKFFDKEGSFDAALNFIQNNRSESRSEDKVADAVVAAYEKAIELGNAFDPENIDKYPEVVSAINTAGEAMASFLSRFEGTSERNAAITNLHKAIATKIGELDLSALDGKDATVILNLVLKNGLMSEFAQRTGLTTVNKNQKLNLTLGFSMVDFEKFDRETVKRVLMRFIPLALAAGVKTWAHEGHEVPDILKQVIAELVQSGKIKAGEVSAEQTLTIVAGDKVAAAGVFSNQAAANVDILKVLAELDSGMKLNVIEQETVLEMQLMIALLVALDLDKNKATPNMTELQDKINTALAVMGIDTKSITPSGNNFLVNAKILIDVILAIQSDQAAAMSA